MATAYLDPDGNNTSVWFVNPYSHINDGIRQPGAINEGATAVEANKDDDNENQEYTMESFDITGQKITEIKIWTYGGILTVDADVNIYFGGWKTPQDLNLPAPASQAWTSNTFTFESTSQANLDGLLLRFTSPTMEAGNSILIHAAYAEVTYEAVGAGPTNVVKWNGIEVGNLVKWNGIPWENIVKYNGID